MNNAPTDNDDRRPQLPEERLDELVRGMGAVALPATATARAVERWGRRTSRLDQQILRGDAPSTDEPEGGDAA